MTAMHEWRKRVKDLRYIAEMLQRREATGKGRRRRKSERRAAERLRKLARRADALGELLGEAPEVLVGQARGQLLVIGMTAAGRRCRDADDEYQDGQGQAMGAHHGSMLSADRYLVDPRPRRDSRREQSAG